MFGNMDQIEDSSNNSFCDADRQEGENKSVPAAQTLDSPKTLNNEEKIPNDTNQNTYPPVCGVAGDDDTASKSPSHLLQLDSEPPETVTHQLNRDISEEIATSTESLTNNESQSLPAGGSPSPPGGGSPSPPADGSPSLPADGSPDLPADGPPSPPAVGSTSPPAGGSSSPLADGSSSLLADGSAGCVETTQETSDSPTAPIQDGNKDDMDVDENKDEPQKKTRVTNNQLLLNRYGRFGHKCSRLL